MQMHSPPHPGEILRDLYIEPLNLTITAASASLGISRQSHSELLNGRNGLSPDMAIRLAKAFPHTDIRFWLGLQLQFDTWHAEQRAPSIHVAPLHATTSPP